MDSSRSGGVGDPVVINVYGSLDPDSVARLIQSFMDRRRGPDDGQTGVPVR